MSKVNERTVKKEEPRKKIGKDTIRTGKSAAVVKKRFSWTILPILLTLGILPLITRMVTKESYVEQLLFHTKGTEKVYDFFLYGKSVLLLIFAGVMLAVLIGRWFYDTQWPQLNYIFIPLGVYALFVLLSSVLSEYQQFSMYGIDDSYQSMFVLLAYCVLTVYCYVMVRSEADIKQICTWWLVGLAVLLFIGLFQFFVTDFWSTWLGRHIMLPIKDWGTGLQFNFVGGRVYMSQFNPNYVGPFAVMIIMVFGVLALFTKEKKRWLFAAAAVGMLICLLGSQSKNGMIALGLTGIVLLVFLRKKLKKYWIVSVVVGVLVVGSFVVMDFTRDHYISKAFVNSWNVLTGKTTAASPRDILEDIQTGKDSVKVFYGGNILEVKSRYLEEGNQMVFSVTDQDGNPIEYLDNNEDGLYELQDERFSDIFLATTTRDNKPCFVLKICGVNWIFTNQVGEEGYYYCAPYGYFMKMKNAETAVFTKMGSLGSGRGYIWARTIPILKETIVLGKGADNFWPYFPYDDFVQSWKNGYLLKTISTPHNMYLQMGVNTGMISLLAFVLFFVLYFIDCIRLYWKETYTAFLPQIGLGLCMATLGYMFTGLLNDSMVCVAPVFWCLIGLGLAVNRIYRKEMGIETAAEKRQKKAESKNRR